MKPLFKVEKTGLMTTFQDFGRTGFQQYGVVVSGAMDLFSLQMANLLVGNKLDEACIEITMLGPKLTALSPTVISICGGNLSPKINGQNVPMWKSIFIHKGDELTFNQPVNGLRAYLAVAGGFNIPKVMNSKSYDSKAKLGTPIQAGDRLYGYEKEVKHGVGLFHSAVPTYKKHVSARVILGPHHHYFTEDSLQTFFNSTYTVTKGDRMGIFLKTTKKLHHRDTADIYSDSIPFGGIQVPKNGQPIILMADRQTTGGYTRIGTVITVDLPKIAQLPPGGTISFEEISVEKAQHLKKEQQIWLKTLQQYVENHV